MKSRSYFRLMGASLAIFAWPPVVANGQTTGTDESSIKKEILSRYKTFEGAAEDQTWEMWQEYFLRSPNIGNMHGDHFEIGWEAYRDGSVAYYQRPVERRAAVRFEDVRVYVIDDRTAWVTGVYVNIIGEREMRPLFYDMLIKTPDGWRVFFSYVAPPG